MRSLIVPLVFLTFLVSALVYIQIHQTKPIPDFWLVLFGLTAFFAGGFGETYVVTQTSLLGLMLIFAIFTVPVDFRKPFVIWSIVGLLCSLISMAITIAAPGNHIRQSYFPPSPDPITLVVISFHSFLEFLGTVFSSPKNILVTILVFVSSGLAGYVFSKQKTVISIPILHRNLFFRDTFHSLLTIFLSGLLLIFVCFPPAAYGMSSAPPLRTQVLPGFFLCSLVVILSMYAGYLIGRSTDISLSTWDRTGWSVFVFLLIFAGLLCTISQTILSVAPDYKFFAARFDRVDSMIREAKINGETSVSVPEVHNFFGLSDYGAGTTLWLDGAVDSYYGINVIVNKNMK
jgi:hypothetical protein